MNTRHYDLQRVCYVPGCAHELALCQLRPGASYFLKKLVDLERLGGSPEATHSGMENGTKGENKGPVSFPFADPQIGPKDSSLLSSESFWAQKLET